MRHTRCIALLAAIAVSCIGRGAAAQSGPLNPPPPPPPPDQTSAGGPIEDTSYPAYLPGGALACIQDRAAGPRYLAELPILHLNQTWAGLELADDQKPRQMVGVGYADLESGVDLGARALLGERPGFAANLRLVSFSPGRAAVVSRLKELDRMLRTATPGGVVPEAWTGDVRGVAETYARWSETPKLGVWANWTTVRDASDTGQVGLSASWLRPLGQSRSAPPSAVELGASLPYVRARMSAGETVSTWNPSVWLAWQDRVFRLNGVGAHLSRWRVQIGGSVGVRNALNSHAPLSFYVRLRIEPSQQALLTPREFASRSATLMLQARRDGLKRWVYGVQVALLR